MPWRHLVNAHCLGAYRRPRLTDDYGARGATANQAGSGDRRCTNPEKLHTKLTSRGTAKLRLNVVAAALLGGCSSGRFSVFGGRFRLRLSDRSLSTVSY
jgi:hypothetical protein